MTGDQPESETARRIGRSAGRFARALRSASRKAQPEVERLAKSAAQAARPAAAEARRFLAHHDEELRQAGGIAAHTLVNRAAPLPLRPVIFAIADDLLKRTTPGDTSTPRRPD